MNDQRSAFFVEHRPDGVAVLRIDVPGESVNSLRANFADELERELDGIEQRSDVKAVVIASGKPDGFIAGADIKMLRALRTVNDAVELTKRGRDLDVPSGQFYTHEGCRAGAWDVRRSVERTLVRSASVKNLPLIGGWNLELLAIFRDGAAREHEPFLLKDIHDLRIAERPLLILGADDLPNPFLDGDR